MCTSKSSTSLLSVVQRNYTYIKFDIFQGRNILFLSNNNQEEGEQVDDNTDCIKGAEEGVNDAKGE